MDDEFIFQYNDEKYEISMMTNTFTFEDITKKIESTVIDLPSVYCLQDRDYLIIKSLEDLKVAIERKNMFIHITEVDLTKITDPRDFIINNTTTGSKKSYQKLVSQVDLGSKTLLDVCSPKLENLPLEKQYSSENSLFLERESELTAKQIVLGYKEKLCKLEQEINRNKEESMEKFIKIVEQLREKLNNHTDYFFKNKIMELQKNESKKRSTMQPKVATNGPVITNEMKVKMLIGATNQQLVVQAVSENPDKSIQQISKIALQNVYK